MVPAPAVIPAPIAYIKVVAVKKLVVEIRAFYHSGPAFMVAYWSWWVKPFWWAPDALY